MPQVKRSDGREMDKSCNPADTDWMTEVAYLDGVMKESGLL